MSRQSPADRRRAYVAPNQCLVRRPGDESSGLILHNSASGRVFLTVGAGESRACYGACTAMVVGLKLALPAMNGVEPASSSTQTVCASSISNSISLRPGRLVLSCLFLVPPFNTAAARTLALQHRQCMAFSSTVRFYVSILMSVELCDSRPCFTDGVRLFRADIAPAFAPLLAPSASCPRGCAPIVGGLGSAVTPE